MHNATQSNTTITTHCTTSTELLLSGTDDSSVTRRTPFKLQQCCHYFVSNPCILEFHSVFRSSFGSAIFPARFNIQYRVYIKPFYNPTALGLWDRVQTVVYSSKPGSLYELNARITNAVHEISEQQRNVFNELEYPCEPRTLTV